jgi:NAD(P)-dependent dehydrogenase (short-subunit alcohol dehydrogenase family)
LMKYPDSNAVPDYNKLSRLDGRGFVVLGGGDGIGRQTCHALAQAGARVMCVDREPSLAEAVAAEVGGIPVAGDVTVRGDMIRIFEQARKEFGDTVRGIVDIVGIATIGKIGEATEETWDRQFDVVLRHAYLAIQIGGDLLAARGGGTMVFVGSISGVVSVAKQAIYGTAKAALHHLVRCAAHELGVQQIRVNAIAPGFVRTPRLLERLSAQFWTQVSDANPLRRVAVPADIAAAVLYLSSDLAGYVTGNVVTLDGGMNFVAALPELDPWRSAASPSG